jgi:DNA-binding PucR family transcriptional regulator
VQTTLRDVLAALGAPLVEVLTTPVGMDTPIDGVAIVDPDDEPDEYTGRLVLVIGVRGRAALGTVRAIARRGAAAVAVKVGSGSADDLRAAVEGSTATVLAVRDDARWDHVEQLARDVVDQDGAGGDPGDLFTLAQTTALLTGGLVSIEDVSSRVLAYSRSDSAAADELRRLSVLGWQGPSDYLRLLREWGVFDTVRAGEDVVRITEHAELGIRPRLAVGIHAGTRWLGTIWVQQGTAPFAERAEEVLLGAARVAAGHLVRRRAQRTAGGQWNHDLVVGLLQGRIAPDVVAATAGIDASSTSVVAAFAIEGSDALGAVELAEVVSVHAAGYRRGALTAVDGSRVYTVLPGVPLDRVERALRAMCAEVVRIAARRTGTQVRAGIGAAAASLAGTPGSRAEADRVLDTMAPGTDVAALADLRSEILLDAVLGLVDGAADVRDPAAGRLVAHDATHGTDLAGSVLAYLDALGDVRQAADALTVHPNTLRHRLRRATAVAGVALGDPSARIVTHLELLRTRRHS